MLRANGVVDTLSFPAGAQTFQIGGQTWVGWADSDGNSHDYVLTPDAGDVVLSAGAGVVKPALGPTAIPNATQPPPGPGPAPTLASNDPAQIANDIMSKR